MPYFSLSNYLAAVGFDQPPGYQADVLPPHYAAPNNNDKNDK